MAYAAFGPLTEPDREARASCEVDGSSCRGHAPSSSAAASSSPKARRTHPPAAAGASPTAKPTTSTSRFGTEFTPYVDVLQNTPFDLASSARTVGIKHYNLAFIVAGNGCTATWGGSLAVSSATVANRVAAFRAAGGHVRISFGGESGTELAAACDSVDELAAAYQSVITAYSATEIDFDVEGSELSNSDANDRRAKAIAVLERTASAAGKTLEVSATLPVGPQGLTSASVSLLSNAASNGATIHVVNIMAMDYGDDAAPNPDGQMGSYAISAMKGTQAQLKSIFKLSDTAAWHRVAVTPLIGVNEPETEVFTTSDAAQLGTFARSKGAAYVSMWAISRDKPCADGVTANATSDACAGNAGQTFAFTKAFMG